MHGSITVLGITSCFIYGSLCWRKSLCKGPVNLFFYGHNSCYISETVQNVLIKDYLDQVLLFAFMSLLCRRMWSASLLVLYKRVHACICEGRGEGQELYLVC